MSLDLIRIEIPSTKLERFKPVMRNTNFII